MGDLTYPLFPIFAFLGFIVALIPLPWHFEAWNAGTCLYMLWASLASLVEFIDAIVWNGTALNVAPVWCDISTKFLIGAGVGIPAASLCINRRLYKISSVSAVTVDRKEKRQAVLEDIGIGLGVPILVMILHYVVQGHRFNILEDVGCTPDIYNTPPAYPLVFMWPILLGCISFVYAALTLRAFWRRRAQFNQLFASNKAMTASRYLRLMLLCCVEMACTIPLGAFSMYINNDGLQVQPYISWANVHYDFSYVELFPAEVWTSRRAFYISVQMGRWIYPCTAFLFFALFGFADEARRHYRLAFWWIARRIGFQPVSQTSSKSSLGFALKRSKAMSEDSLPSYYPPAHVRQKHSDSLSSFSPSVLAFDLEKGAPLMSPLDSVRPNTGGACASVDSSMDLVSQPRISISNEYPPSMPPSPDPLPHGALATLPRNRPFSPPTVCPAPSSCLQQDTVIPVSIHMDTVKSD
ncbi:putative fungal pheromone GPCR, STE3-type [Amylocystis lapponica]|nr:putative fungal pheromone GPCR, STE3-type [Amylocystis lapponica]